MKTDTSFKGKHKDFLLVLWGIGSEAQLVS
jgi:hypothetical protein